MRIRNTMAAILAAAMVLSTAGSAFAATTSPTSGTPATETPATETPAATQPTTTNDPNQKDHIGNEVVSEVKNGTATVISCVSLDDETGKAVEFEKAADPATGAAVDITVIGNGKKGVFDSKAGRKVKTMKVNSAASKVIVKAKAFKGSKIKTVTVATKKLEVKKNAFKGTKQKKITLKFSGKKSGALVVKKGALKGLTKITVKGLSKKEFKKVQKKLRKAGFKGTIKKG